MTWKMRIPGDEGSDRGLLDHLFLDQDAVPTLVEVKRSDNTGDPFVVDAWALFLVSMLCLGSSLSRLVTGSP